MNKVLLPLLFITAACSDKVNKKAYQIVVTPNKEYYTTFYNVDHDTGCIDFISYTDNDSSYVKICGPWDVKPNTDYKP